MRTDNTPQVGDRYISWRLDGSPGPLSHDHAHGSRVSALALAQHQGGPLLISAGFDHAIRSWRLDGSPGPLSHDHAHDRAVNALALAQHQGAPLLISADEEGVILAHRIGLG